MYTQREGETEREKGCFVRLRVLRGRPVPAKWLSARPSREGNGLLWGIHW